MRVFVRVRGYLSIHLCVCLSVRGLFISACLSRLRFLFMLVCVCVCVRVQVYLLVHAYLCLCSCSRELVWDPSVIYTPT